MVHLLPSLSRSFGEPKVLLFRGEARGISG